MMSNIDDTSLPMLQQKKKSTKETKTTDFRVVIDADGELCLAVGEESTVSFVVCPRTLARASPVWKKLLYGGFAESVRPNDGNEWVIELPEDNPKAMEVFLNIIHSYFDKIPASVHFPKGPIPAGATSFKDLYRLAVLTDKYDLTRLLQPWARGWVKDIETYDPFNTNKWHDEGDMALLPWVAWEFGCEALFRKAVKYLCLHCITDPNGDLRRQRISCESPPLFYYALEPGSLSAVIKTNRLQIIAEMLGPVKDAAMLLLEETECCHSPKQNCSATMLGTMVKLLTPAGLYPVPEPERIHISVIELASKLKPLDSMKNYYDHTSLSSIKLLGTRIADKIVSVDPQLEDFYVQHLAAQSKKIGLSS
ncbi:hypothetical protein F4804DRAFT_317893 [Jackrogersella minutella]|nr:hypothetical protein F4804DRAFT_317893 [Jackrogersella minutella]